MSLQQHLPRSSGRESSTEHGHAPWGMGAECTSRNAGLPAIATIITAPVATDVPTTAAPARRTFHQGGSPWDGIDHRVLTCRKASPRVLSSLRLSDLGGRLHVLSQLDVRSRGGAGTRSSGRKEGERAGPTVRGRGWSLI